MVSRLSRHFFDGSASEAAPPLVLRAGPLALLFEEGGLRYIRLGRREIVRRVYCAVRDANWETVPDRIGNLQADVRDDWFRIEFEVANQRAEIDFIWHGTITGEGRGRIVFEMDGVARSTFCKNRIGFCVLHPMDFAGIPVEVRHPDGRVERSEFPRYIAPQNPFLDVVAMRHAVEPGLDVELTFEGDVFETEDQRNWIDASFKTFCTPLSRPFPAEVKAGERIVQRVTIELLPKTSLPSGESGLARAEPGDRLPMVTLQMASEPSGTLPRIGLALPADAEPLTPRQIQLLRRLKPAHLRCELTLSDDVEDILQRATAMAADLSAELELALFVGPDAERELGELVKLVRRLRLPIARWIVFPETGWATTRELAEVAASVLRQHDPQIPIGGGTPANFRELNDCRPPVEQLDFVVWSLTPQIHAFDNTSIVETLAAHVATVEAARQFAGGLPIVVGPVTLKMRVNPYATGPWPPPTSSGQLPPQVDPRQMSLFGAGWTLGSIKYLAESRVQAATYYELVGWKGLLEHDRGSPLPDLFPSLPGSVFPLYHVFAELAELRAAKVWPIRSSDPLRVEALALCDGSMTRVLIANLSREPQTVVLPTEATSASVRFLDTRNVREAMTSPEAYRSRGASQSVENKSLKFDFLPYAVARVDLA